MSNTKILGAYALNPSTAQADDVLPIGRPGNTDARAVTAQSIADLAGGGSPLQLPIQDGRYYLSHMEVAPDPAVTFDVADFTDYMIAVPILFTEDKTWTEIAAYCTTGNGGDVARLGIFADNGGTPAGGALVVDAGEIDLSSTGVKPKAISTALTANTWYWRVAAFSGAGSFLIGPTENFDWLPFVWGLNDIGGSHSIPQAVYAPHTYGALPSTFPAVEGYWQNPPSIALRTGV